MHIISYKSTTLCNGLMMAIDETEGNLEFWNISHQSYPLNVKRWRCIREKTDDYSSDRIPGRNQITTRNLPTMRYHKSSGRS